MFGLWHTHEQPDLGVDKCPVTGDYCCDTPPDPGPGIEPWNCTQTSKWFQPPDCATVCPNGETPDTYNVMSYYNCGELPGSSHFSGCQTERMECYIARHFQYAMHETCNGVDDNGNGKIDEELKNVTCGTDEGDCKAGFKSCVDGKWSKCEGQVLPAKEICDGTDNDCDGEVDNDVDAMTEPSAKCADKGICGAGGAQEVCLEGHWECEHPPGYVESECPIINDCGFGSLNDP